MSPYRKAAVRAVSTVPLVAVGLVVLTAGPATAAPVELTAAVCPEAPPGVQAFADQVTAWVKWGVLALIGIAAVVSLGSVLVGRMFSHPHASRFGAMGVAVVVMVAITYTVILVILDSITGSGCT
ncbi:hypothetical protein [Candidatus Blastococcus massiliensis]|uniref:hypothetical protein n=1 Tax=Candidatus Blastococcus massiliensis TaxID=1470358 RepID=UPI0004B0918E|nr:hypothetical protein [Candidatus Blastococcus massiliensis]